MPTELAYNAEYQALLLSECVRNPQFNELVRDTVTVEQFCDRALQWFFQTITNAPVVLSKRTLGEELTKAVQQKKVRREEFERYAEVLRIVTRPPLPEESEHLKVTLNKFVRTQNVKRAIEASFDLIEEGKWEELETVVSDALASGIDVLSLGHDYFKDYQARLEKRDLFGEARKIPTGIPECDICLNGGIKNKQVGLIVGGTGRGKSIFLAWLARQAVQLGKTVIYFTLELSEEDIAERLDSMFARVRPTEIRAERDLVALALSEYEQYAGKLFLKEFAPGSTPVSAFKTYFKNLAAQGIVADLVVIDYLDLVRPSRRYQNDQAAEMRSTCISLCAFAKDCDTRIWTATQLNRGGMVSENPDESSIMGSVEKLYNVDIALFMAQTQEQSVDEIMRLIITKNRNGKRGSFKIETDYGYFQFYREQTAVDEAPDEEPDKSLDEELLQA